MQPAPSQPEIDFNHVAKRVFEVVGGKVMLGGQEIEKQLRDALREEAKFIQPSRFWEVLHATIINEAAKLALNDSRTWEHVQVAKMLAHWDHVMENLVYFLSKD